MNIQWYPGHMTKTMRMLQENISLVDIVIELLDARIPYSSKNPDIDKLAQNKKRIIILNKADLADESANAAWTSHFAERGIEVVSVNSTTGKGLDAVTAAAKALMQEKLERLRAKGRIFVPTRAMIVGVPNVGKSTLINRYAGSSMAKTADKPGVTRSKQWIKVRKDFELLDTPGILWPKFDDQFVGISLAATGAVNDDILDTQTLACELIKRLAGLYPDALTKRYGVEPLTEGAEPFDVLTQIAAARGFLQKGGAMDTERAAIILIDEFRGGRLGRISLERPDTPKTMDAEKPKQA